MPLTTVSRYDRDRVSEIGETAVVVGGSMAGLLAARVLADGYEEVTIIDRDPLPEHPSARRGVPQGRHIHVLLEAGRATLDDLFPGYGEELLSAGGLLVDFLSDFVVYDKGGFLADGKTRLPTYFATRPLFEHVVRRRVAEHDGVHIRPNCHYTDYIVDDAMNVEGVLVRDDDGERGELPADLVVDATGRTSKTPSWLEQHGYAPPDVTEVEIDVAYSTVVVERPSDDRRAFFVAADPPRTRGAGIFPAEDARWLATFFGMHGDHPPTDAEGLRDFAASLPGPDLERLLETQPWITDEIAHYPFPSNRRYRYEDLTQFPEGLVVVGDAIASLNPIYGQGMSVAALEALLFHHTLATDDAGTPALDFFDRVEEIVDVAWSMTVGADFEFPRTDGPKPRGTDLLNRYMSRLTRKAHTDGALREALFNVFAMKYHPNSLLRPGVAWRVLRPTSSDTGTTSRLPSKGVLEEPS